MVVQENKSSSNAKLKELTVQYLDSQQRFWSADDLCAPASRSHNRMPNIRDVQNVIQHGTTTDQQWNPKFVNLGDHQRVYASTPASWPPSVRTNLHATLNKRQTPVFTTRTTIKDAVTIPMVPPLCPVYNSGITSLVKILAHLKYFYSIPHPTKVGHIEMVEHLSIYWNTENSGRDTTGAFWG